MNEFLDLVPVRPLGAQVPPDAFGDTASPAEWIRSCELRTEGGNPGCVLVLADLLPDSAGSEIILITKKAGNWVQAESWARSTNGAWQSKGLPVRIAGPSMAINSDSVVDRILDDEFLVGPKSVQALQIGGTAFILLP
jgi:hypothetical protein